jgi:hypothetical protein
MDTENEGKGRHGDGDQADRETEIRVDVKAGIRQTWRPR